MLRWAKTLLMLISVPVHSEAYMKICGNNVLKQCNILVYSRGHNILTLFEVLPNFAFPTSETKRDYY